MQRMLAKVGVYQFKVSIIQSEQSTVKKTHKNPNRVYTLGYFQSEINDEQGQTPNFSIL